MGRFSSDRTIREYAETVWKVNAVGALKQEVQS